MTITIPSHLSDGALMAGVTRCARDERHATAQLVAHLAELDARQLYLATPHASLFAYCHHALGLSEDAAYSRAAAARACRLFPRILDALVDGSLTITAVRLLARHLTADNHGELLDAASRRSTREIEELIARRFPTADTPSSVRKVPERTPSSFGISFRMAMSRLSSIAHFPRSSMRTRVPGWPPYARRRRLARSPTAFVGSLMARGTSRPL